MNIADFKRLFRYEAWATARTFEYVKKMSDPPADVLKLLAHNVAAQELWYNRLTGEGPVPKDYWQEMPLEECRQRQDKMRERWEQYFAKTPEARFGETIHYVRLEKPCTNLVADVLTHMITHSMYHRGQIAWLVRKAGGDPMPTDFVAAGREGSLD